MKNQTKFILKEFQRDRILKVINYLWVEIEIFFLKPLIQ